MSTENWQYGVEKAIQEAMAAGEFDNLPGQGQPLNLVREGTDPTLWAAHHLLRTGGFKPDWIAERKELEKEVEAARAALRRSWRWRSEALAAGESLSLIASQWDKALRRFRAQVDKLNPRIRSYNLKTRVVQMQIRVLDVEREIERAQAE
jgi:hypothetical protein